MNRVFGHVHWSLCTMLILSFLVAGCSDDDPVTEPEEVDPRSYVFQVNALPDGAAFAGGMEGSTGLLYTNLGGSWTQSDNQPLAGVAAALGGVRGVLPVSEAELYVFASAGMILHLEEDQWVNQTMEITPGSASLQRTAGGIWCLGSEGVLLKESNGEWDTVLDTGDADSFFSGIAESPDGTVFASQVFYGQREGTVHRISPGGSATVDDFESLVYAVAATETDTVWAAGTRLHRYADAAWDTTTTIPDRNLVVAIGQPADGSLILVCIEGPIYRWHDEELTTVQEFDLRGQLASVCFIDEDTIYGSVNFIEPNTGHQTGIIVRFDGVQWVTAYLAPPGLKEGI